MTRVTSTLHTRSNSACKRRGKNNRRGEGNLTEDASTIQATLTDSRAGASRIIRNDFNKASRDLRGETVVKKTKSPTGRRSPNTVIHLEGPNRLRSSMRRVIDEGPEKAEKRLDEMRGAIRTLLVCVGEDPDREGLIDTPARCAKALLFLTQGYHDNVKNIINNALFNEGHREMIVVKNIEISSLCEHHLLPFTGKMHIGYIPSDTVIGLSKFPRIAEMFSRRLQIQERLTKEVADAIMGLLNPQGVAVIMESYHLCMMMRGVEKTSSTTVTSCVLGCFEDFETRDEFMGLVGVKGT